MTEKKKTKKKPVFQVAPVELQKSLKEIRGEKGSDRVRCSAGHNYCNECDRKFKKKEEVCPDCNTPREPCKRFASAGATTCPSHGGSGGRPILTDENGVPLNYNNDKERLQAKYDIKKFEDFTEVAGYKCLMLIEQMENALDMEDYSDMSSMFDGFTKIFGQLISFGKMKAAKKEANTKAIVGEKVSTLLDEITKDILIKRCFIICMNAFIDALKGAKVSQEEIDKISALLPDFLVDPHQEQDIYFSKVKDIIVAKHADIVVEDREGDDD